MNLLLKPAMCCNIIDQEIFCRVGKALQQAFFNIMQWGLFLEFDLFTINFV